MVLGFNKLTEIIITHPLVLPAGRYCFSVSCCGSCVATSFLAITTPQMVGVKDQDVAIPEACFLAVARTTDFLVLVCNRDVMEPAEICFGQIQISHLTSVLVMLNSNCF